VTALGAAVEYVVVMRRRKTKANDDVEGNEKRHVAKNYAERY